ncbi:hypothetical protein [Acidicapsa acidisoli]|uniref:hypothetical protein n=1 Tax=Acidicapsa acidisoli TaxID=1615681 RepID=UPI0021E0D61F|nr:hypothetical protein [Acidicapsa acidisoli]
MSRTSASSASLMSRKLWRQRGQVLPWPMLVITMIFGSYGLAMCIGCTDSSNFNTQTSMIAAMLPIEHGTVDLPNASIYWRRRPNSVR